MSVQTPATVSTALSAAPIVAHVVRSGFVESVHHGTVVVTDPQGRVELAIGDPSGPVFPRSSGKYAQAIAMARHGLPLDGPYLALACASHSGEDFHQRAVLEVLAGAGLSEAHLQNTPDFPLDEKTRLASIAAGGQPTSLAQNCSGKHAAMLATCVANGWDTTSYRDPEHPLQQAISHTVEELAGEKVVSVAVDGCGAPIHAFPLTGLARTFGRVAAATEGVELRVANAVRANPEYLGGTGRDVTELIRGVPGLVAKDGAESVYAVGLPDGRGVAVKIADGGARARSVVLAGVLRHLGVTGDAAFAALEHQPVLGHGQPVGAVVAADFTDLLRSVSAG